MDEEMHRKKPEWKSNAHIRTRKAWQILKRWVSKWRLRTEETNVILPSAVTLRDTGMQELMSLCPLQQGARSSKKTSWPECLMSDQVVVGLRTGTVNIQKRLVLGLGKGMLLVTSAVFLDSGTPSPTSCIHSWKGEEYYLCKGWQVCWHFRDLVVYPNMFLSVGIQEVFRNLTGVTLCACLYGCEVEQEDLFLAFPWVLLYNHTLRTVRLRALKNKLR